MILPVQTSKKTVKTVETKKAPVKRIIATTSKWDFGEHELNDENQLALLEKPGSLILQQIQQKLHGYHNQDTRKSILDGAKFITLDQTIELLISRKLICFYCNILVKVLYDFVREPKQWSLERIDNKFGHNHDNVTIACLKCNLGRRTMKQERYLFTKQVGTVRRLGYDNAFYDNALYDNAFYDNALCDNAFYDNPPLSSSSSDINPDS